MTIKPTSVLIFELFTFLSNINQRHQLEFEVYTKYIQTLYKIFSLSHILNYWELNNHAGVYFVLIKQEEKNIREG